jgi:hypothetical protein
MKRSSQVALLLMGTVAVGGTAYAVMPHENCQPGVIHPDGLPSQTSRYCSGTSGSTSNYRYWSGSSWGSSSTSSTSSSSHPSYFASDGRTILGSSTSGEHGSSSSSSSVSRGGYGSFASHFSGGG